MDGVCQERTVKQPPFNTVRSIPPRVPKHEPPLLQQDEVALSVPETTVAPEPALAVAAPSLGEVREERMAPVHHRDRQRQQRIP